MSSTPGTNTADAYETAEALLCEMQGLRDELEDVKRERDAARDTVFRLRKQRAIARNFGAQMERDRDEARVECLEQCRLLALGGDREERLREALQSVMGWNPKPEPTDRPQTVARFEADMARAREVLERAK